MEDKSSITALMSAFGRAFHAENEEQFLAELHFLSRKSIGVSMKGGKSFGIL